MKILIVGSNYNAFLIAKYMKTQFIEHDIYLTTDIPSADKIYTPIGIKENDIKAIVDFAKYNQIDFTISVSSLAVINAIADEFENENMHISAPYSDAARITLFNSIAKKVMYKLKINTPRFGIFDRENIAIDYVRQCKFPVVILNDFTLAERKCDVFKNYGSAKLELQKIFENVNEKIVVENYIDGKIVYLYFLTDGYNALPLISLERKGYSNFTQIKAPSEKITYKMLLNILKTAVYPVLDDISKCSGNYSGILGMKIKIKDNNFYVLEYYNEFLDYDMQVFLSLLNDDLAQLFSLSALKQLGNKNLVQLKNKSSYTIILDKTNIKKEIEDDDFFITEDEKNIIITKTASTMNYAKISLEDYLDEICKKEFFENIKIATKEVIRV